MPKKQLFALFMCNLIPYVVGSGLLSLLPIYISNELGAGTTITGIILAIAFVVLVMSTSMSSSISRRFGGYRDIITVCSLLCIPALWYAGQTQNTLLLTVLLCVEWFFGGLQIALIQIVIALSVDKNERGRTFGILATGGPLSQIIGGLAASFIVTRWGFEGLFLYCALLYLFSMLMSRIIIDPNVPEIAPKSSKADAPIPIALLMIMGASVFAYIASFIISMARPLAMDALNFETGAVAGVVTVSGFVTLGLPFLAGWASDKFGRRFVFIGIYAVTALGAAGYIVAGELWQFWVAQAFVSVLSASMAVGSALVTDNVAAQDTDRNISYFATTPWIGAVIGSAGTGIAIQHMGISMVFVIAVGLLAIAIVLGSGISVRNRLFALRNASA